MTEGDWAPECHICGSLTLPYAGVFGCLLCGHMYNAAGEDTDLPDGVTLVDFVTQRGEAERRFRETHAPDKPDTSVVPSFGGLVLEEPRDSPPDSF